ncbi:MAG TPA: aldehyde dehydrogenase family protein, partial [Ramlibacter sp.]|nr:aldehyde dehydrogenase family protein [Ramlibacter sp.]
MNEQTLVPDTDPHRLARTLSGFNLVDGALTGSMSGKTFPVANPATGREIGRAPDSDARDVAGAVEAAARAQPAWAAMPARKRGALIADCSRLLTEHVEELGRLVALETGKALRTESRIEASVVADALQFYGGLGSELKGETVPFNPDMLTMTQREPIGVVGVIIPWNAPMMLMALKIAPALVAGNTVVVKSAEEAPLAVLRVCQILNQKLPAGVLNIVSGFGPECGAPLVAHPAVGKVTFTGSVETGRIVARTAGEKLIPVTLELGGKSPMIVMDDADIPKA